MPLSSCRRNCASGGRTTAAEHDSLAVRGGLSIIATARKSDGVSSPKLVLGCDANVSLEFAPVNGDFPRMSGFGIEGGTVEQPTWGRLQSFIQPVKTSVLGTNHRRVGASDAEIFGTGRTCHRRGGRASARASPRAGQRPSGEYGRAGPAADGEA